MSVEGGGIAAAMRNLEVIMSSMRESWQQWEEREEGGRERRRREGGRKEASENVRPSAEHEN